MVEKEAVARWSSNELAASFSLRDADDAHGDGAWRRAECTSHR